MVIHQPHLARCLPGLTECAADVARVAALVGEDAKVPGAVWALPGRHLFRGPLSAVDAPVVVAVVVDGALEGALGGEEEAVVARLVGQGAVGARVEVVAGVRVRVELWS